MTEAPHRRCRQPALVRTVSCLLGATLLAVAAARPEEAPRSPSPSVPVIRLVVRAPERENLDIMAPVLEGRLLSRLQNAEGFHLVPGNQEAGFSLLLEIQELKYSVQTEPLRSYDADVDPHRANYENNLSGQLDVDLTLTRAGRPEPVYEDTLSFVASRKLDDLRDAERVRNTVVDDLMERVADKMPKILKRRAKE